MHGCKTRKWRKPAGGEQGFAGSDSHYGALLARWGKSLSPSIVLIRGTYIDMTLYRIGAQISRWLAKKAEEGTGVDLEVCCTAARFFMWLVATRALQQRGSIVIEGKRRVYSRLT